MGSPQIAQAIGFADDYDAAAGGPSIKEQEKAICRWCRENGYYSPEIVTDTGFGVIEAIVDVMRETVASKKALVISDLSRLGDALPCVFAHLHKAGVRIASVKEGIDTWDPESEKLCEFLPHLLRHFPYRPEYAPPQEWADRCGAVPYGWRVSKKTGRIIRDPNEFWVLQKMLEHKRNKYSCNAIAKWLRVNRIPSKRGGLWQESTVRKTLEKAEQMEQQFKDQCLAQYQRENPQPPPPSPQV